MEIRDYNGESKWSKDAIMSRYLEYCRQLSIHDPLDISPYEHIEGDVHWVYPVMHEIIEGIEQGDAACKRIGMEFIEEDSRFPFGRILKSNTARALRRCALTEDDKARIRLRVVSMLITGLFFREYKQYAKLLRKIGVGEHWETIEKGIDRSNPYVMRYYRYLKEG